MLRLLILITILALYAHCESCMDSMITCPDMKNACDVPTIKSECPLSCGLCTQDPTVCSDTNMHCDQFENMCFQLSFQNECPKTCGACKPQSQQTTVPTRTAAPLRTTTVPKPTVPPSPTVITTTVPSTTKTTTTKKPTPTTPKQPCKDSSPNCPAWAKNGFCTNTFYPPEKRKEYCAKTCKFC